MLRVWGSFFVVLLAFGVLLVSILRVSLPNYIFYQPASYRSENVFVSGVEYYFPYPGALPGSFVWPLKAFRDWAWLLVNRDFAKRAELLLLFSDKRVEMARILFEDDRADLAIPTAIKAEQYLEDSFNEQERASLKGIDTTGFLERLAKASLKHREVLEGIIPLVPEDARPGLVKTLDYSKNIYEKTIQELNRRGRPIPELIRVK